MSAEKSLMLDVGEVQLEARLAPGHLARLAVISHPHPLMGGNMDNNVVLAARDALQAAGYATLRFNFRGAGRSTLTHSGGDGEAEDLVALMARMAEHAEAADGLLLAGYSFGAWVTLKAVARGAQAQALLLISPPVDFTSFQGLTLPEASCLVVYGDQDGYCTRTSLEAWLTAQPTQPTVVPLPGGDHFYWQKEEALRRAIGEFLSTR